MTVTGFTELFTMVLGIEFAPILSIPLERRLQTLAVLTYILLFLLAPIVCILFYAYALMTSLAPVALGYLGWIVYDVAVKKTSSRGGRRIDWFRRSRIWIYFRDFFPVSLVKTAELDPGRNYLLGYHPHGILGCGAFANFATEATDFSGVYPGITPHLLTLKPNFRFPLIRALLLWSGVCDVSRDSVEWILTKQGTGNAAVIVVGGAEEALEARPGKYEITLKQRKGFIKLAIKTGACLVPVFSFGENDLFYQADNPRGSYLRTFQESFKRIFGFSPPLFHGRGIFNYTFGILPFRKPVHTVVGRPIEVEKTTDPGQALVDSVHEEYTKALGNLFDEYKVRFGVDSNLTLNFV